MKVKFSSYSPFAVSYLCLLIDFIGLLSGCSTFSERTNLFHVVVHFTGSFLMTSFIGNQYREDRNHSNDIQYLKLTILFHFDYRV